MDERRLTAKEVADILGFTTTNLKHYASLLEGQGLQIYRNTRDHREYMQNDVKLLRAMQYLNRERSMSLADAASFVMSADTDIDAILTPKKTVINANDDANILEPIRVVSEDNDNDSTELALVNAQLSQSLAVLADLQSQLEASHQLHTQFMASIDDKMSEQATIISSQAYQLKQQSEMIEQLAKEMDELKRLQVAERKRSIWSRLFGR